MTQSNTDPNAKLDQSKITDAGAVELVEGELDEAAGGTPVNPSAPPPISLLAKAASGKF